MMHAANARHPLYSSFPSDLINHTQVQCSSALINITFHLPRPVLDLNDDCNFLYAGSGIMSPSAIFLDPNTNTFTSKCKYPQLRTIDESDSGFAI